MKLQLRQRLTGVCALVGLSGNHTVKQPLPAPACDPGRNQELIPLAVSGGQPQCLDLMESAGLGAFMSLASCDSQVEAPFRYWRGHVLVGRCRCLSATKLAPGSAVASRACTRRRTWQFRGGQLHHRPSGLCLDYTAALATPGAAVVVAPCNTPMSQQAFVLGYEQANSAYGSLTATQPGSTQTSAPASSSTASSVSTSSTALSAPAASATVLSGYNLIWRDEFNNNTIDSGRWTLVESCNNANHELQCYTGSPRNAHVAEGLLHIDVIKEPLKGRNYTSARLTSYGKFNFTYGLIEASIKLPCGGGLWPAFWLMPTTSVYGPWPQSGELDVMEFLGQSPNVVTATAHYGASGTFGGQAHLFQNSFCDGFHRFALNWTAESLTWLLDGFPFATLPNPQGSGYHPNTWPFDQPFYPILNVAMGGDWPGPPDASVMGATMLVDYVRVYQPTREGRAQTFFQKKIGAS